MLSVVLLLSAAIPAASRLERQSIVVPRLKLSVRVPSSGRWVPAFGSPKYFTDKYIPADKPGTVLKVPDFDALFDEICKVSPLAKQAFAEDDPGGIKAIDETADVYMWKVIDSNPNRLVSHIDKIDNFQDKGVPLLRCRSSLRGPTKKRAECFSELISTTSLRQKWDATNAFVDTIYSAADLQVVEDLQGGKYGKPSLFGIGYVRTKQSVVSPREQLTLCGLQNFPSGASVIWGVELEEDQNHLFPKNEPNRKPRSTSHLWSTTLIPTGEDTFDVEYILQLEVGGFPGWLTGPVVIETVKKMFRFAEGYFRSGLEGGELAKRLALFPDDNIEVVDSVEMVDAVEMADDSLEAGSVEFTERYENVLDAKQTLLMPP